MHRLCFPALALLLSISYAAAQNAPDCGRAAERLYSNTASEKAWGAHLAVTCKIPALGPAIAAELERLGGADLARFPSASEEFWLRRSLLDSLIQLRAPLPAAILTSLAVGYPAEATILMLQYEAANQTLLFDMRRAHPDGLEWMAASNALIRLHTPGFAAAVLTEIPLTHQFRVSESGSALGRGRGGSISSGRPPAFHAPRDFPPVRLYRLTTTGGDLVSDGAPAIYAFRLDFEPGVDAELAWPVEGTCPTCLDRGYLAQMAHVTPQEIDSVVRSQTGIAWTDVAQVNAAVNQAIAAQQAKLKEIAYALVRGGYLQPAELGMTLKITIEIRDERQDRSTPLSGYPPVSFQLR